jgi:hypothetical protein
LGYLIQNEYQKRHKTIQTGRYGPVGAGLDRLVLVPVPVPLTDRKKRCM